MNYSYKGTYSFSFPTNIRFGIGVIKELGDYLKSEGVKKPFIVTDTIIRELDFFKSIIDQLTTSPSAVPHIFCDIHKNPVKSDVLTGVEEYKKGNCDAVVAIGGGAPTDVARAILLAINNHRDLFDYDDLEGGAKHVVPDVPLFVTVPTTSGTGSEVGRAAIISENDSKRKRILFHPCLMAKQVFADPALTFDLPPEITASTGMDALTHNLEAFLAKGFHPMADGVALEGARLIFKSIVKATREPDEESRFNMLMGSLMGAVAFQKGLGIVHAMSHPLSTLLDMHHGLANAINLPYGLAFNYDGNEQKFDQIALVMDTSGGMSVVDEMSALNVNLSIPLHLGEVGVTLEHLDTITNLAMRDFCLPANPNEINESEMKRLYTLAIG